MSRGLQWSLPAGHLPALTTLLDTPPPPSLIIVSVDTDGPIVSTVLLFTGLAILSHTTTPHCATLHECLTFIDAPSSISNTGCVHRRIRQVDPEKMSVDSVLTRCGRATGCLITEDLY